MLFRHASSSACRPSTSRAAAALLALAVFAALPAAAAAQGSQPRSSVQPDAGASLQTYLRSLWPLAQARGISRATFEGAIRGLTPDPAIVALTKKQSEFVAPIWTYLNNAVGGNRIARGRALLEANAAALDQIERAHGVPKEIILGIWGMETGFGSFKGDKDVIRSLATLAAIRYRGDFFRDEFLTALEMLEKGLAERGEMRGSWAGAMGHTQFMPSSYMKHAVSYQGSGHADVWNNALDALASTGNYLKNFGWRPGVPWGFEVTVPEGFDYRLNRAAFSAFAAAGVNRADGRRMPASGEGRLFFPAGHTGPAFVLTENFDVIKTYNMSDAYALAVGHLADRIAGRGAIRAEWPTSAPRLAKAQIQDLQRRLNRLGLYRGDGDGRIGSGTREAVRQYQLRSGMIADGWPTPALLARLRGGS